MWVRPSWGFANNLCDRHLCFIAKNNIIISNGNNAYEKKTRNFLKSRYYLSVLCKNTYYNSSVVHWKPKSTKNNKRNLHHDAAFNITANNCRETAQAWRWSVTHSQITSMLLLALCPWRSGLRFEIALLLQWHLRHVIFSLWFTQTHNVFSSTIIYLKLDGTKQIKMNWVVEYKGYQGQWTMMF